MAEKLEPFRVKMRRLLREKEISIFRFEFETGICRKMLYPCYKSRPTRATLMALAYYLEMRVEDLVDGTDAMDAWYR